MARMSTELTVVLVGSSLLTAGYFYYRNDDPAADTFAADTQASASQHHRSHVHPMFLPMMMMMRSGYSSNRTSGLANRSSGSISRGGFGSTVASHTSSGS